MQILGKAGGGCGSGGRVHFGEGGVWECGDLKEEVMPDANLRSQVVPEVIPIFLVLDHHWKGGLSHSS